MRTNRIVSLRFDRTPSNYLLVYSKGTLGMSKKHLIKQEKSNSKEKTPIISMFYRSMKNIDSIDRSVRRQLIDLGEGDRMFKYAWMSVRLVVTLNCGKVKSRHCAHRRASFRSISGVASFRWDDLAGGWIGRSRAVTSFLRALPAPWSKRSVIGSASSGFVSQINQVGLLQILSHV